MLISVTKIFALDSYNIQMCCPSLWLSNLQYGKAQVDSSSVRQDPAKMDLPKLFYVVKLSQLSRFAKTLILHLNLNVFFKRPLILSVVVLCLNTEMRLQSFSTKNVYPRPV